MNHCYFYSLVILVVDISIFINLTMSSCKSIISEINGDTPTNSRENMFIELEFVCSSENDEAHAAGYKLLIINGNKGKQADVELYANLKEFSSNLRQFYTIGKGLSDHQSTMSMSFSDSKVFFRTKDLPNNQRTLFSSGTLSLSVPKAVLLVYATGTDSSIIHNKLRLINSNPVKIDDSLKDILKKTLKDMIVYGRKCPVNKCSIFEDLFEPLRDEKLYMIRDVNKGGTEDSSLSRCSEVPEPFQFRYFKIGKPTPGKKNDCSGAFYFLEEELARTIQPLPYERGASTNNEHELSVPEFHVERNLEGSNKKL